MLCFPGPAPDLVDSVLPNVVIDAQRDSLAPVGSEPHTGLLPAMVDLGGAPADNAAHFRERLVSLGFVHLSEQRQLRCLMFKPLLCCLKIILVNLATYKITAEIMRGYGATA